MWIRILGSAAGGGFPQWNCHCPNCRGARDGSLPCRRRTQSSIAVSADYRHWFLFNAAPDISSQIDASPPLWPQGNVRHTPIQGIVLSDAELDHTIGLLSLREARRLRIYTTEWIYIALTQWNPILCTLSNYCAVEWQPMRLGEPVSLVRADGMNSGLQCQAFATLSTKVVAYAAEPTVHPEASVGYRITEVHTGHAIVYLPAVQELHAEVLSRLHNCACLLIDGTCWFDDELARTGISSKTARAMGHLPIAGAGGSLEQLVTLNIDRIVYIHINNTNPLLIENSPQRQTVEAHSIEVAFDGLEMEV
jgi:pyrroloquinoline quinone biosynthesis protein B